MQCNIKRNCVSEVKDRIVEVTKPSGIQNILFTQVRLDQSLLLSPNNLLKDITGSLRIVQGNWIRLLLSIHILYAGSWSPKGDRR